MPLLIRVRLNRARRNLDTESKVTKSKVIVPSKTDYRVLGRDKLHSCKWAPVAPGFYDPSTCYMHKLIWLVNRAAIDNTQNLRDKVNCTDKSAHRNRREGRKRVKTRIIQHVLRNNQLVKRRGIPTRNFDIFIAPELLYRRPKVAKYLHVFNDAVYRICGRGLGGGGYISRLTSSAFWLRYHDQRELALSSTDGFHAWNFSLQVFLHPTVNNASLSDGRQVQV